MVNDSIVAFFSDAVSAMDEETFSTTSGRHEDQQLWELLALLVALRLWLDDPRPELDTVGAKLHGKRIQLVLKGDNVGSLTLAVKLRPKGPKMALLSREIALLLAKLSFAPKALHTPGVAHVVADKLSRLQSDDDDYPKTHQALLNVVRESCADRNRQWYRTISPYAPLNSA